MLILWDWIIQLSLVTGFGLIAYQYYRRQGKRFRDGKHNEDMDIFRGGGCCN